MSLKLFNHQLLAIGALVGAVAACLSFYGCQSKAAGGERALFEVLDSTQTQISFTNHVQDTDKLNILSYLYFYNGAGVAAGDLNNDGLVDLYFVSNQGKNKLYLNKGNFAFEDVSEAAGVEGYSDWQTGVAMADVNGDGLLDIYVCAVSDFKGLEGANELYINNGADADGKVSFTEMAADYGLDFTGFSTQAAFFDHDRDGDLDVYLLNHAVHTSRSYDRVNTRNLRHNEAGDVLYENQLITSDGAAEGKVVKFKDISEKAGIYGAAMGYGLGVVVADMNNDGWDDIYVANDFHEDDYYYLNNGDGTFTESVKNHFQHLSRFSMGCDAADMNNDGYPDLMTLDMYPEDEVVEKSSMGEDPLDIFLYKLQFGYYNQYSRNCLQLSHGGEKFSDVGLMAGVAATDWSWSTLLADYDNDGIKDIFISNGIVHRPNNMDYVKFASTDSMHYAPEISSSLDQKAISMMPEGKVHNYLYKGSRDLRFQDKSLAWGFAEPTVSNGAVYADLNNDGHLELVTNNINQPAGIYKNNGSERSGNNYLKVKLKGDKLNTFGHGAKVLLKSNGAMQVQQLMPTRGFMSSVEPVLNFGLGKQARVDTLIVIWANQKTELRTNVPANAILVLEESAAEQDADVYYSHFAPKHKPLFEDVTNAYQVSFTHKENNYFDFYRESLIPFQTSTEGPKVAVSDVNGDGLDDFYVGGAKWQAGALYVQRSDGNFILSNQSLFQADSIYEDVDAAFFDANNDQYPELYVVSGGNEFYGEMKEQFDRLYLNDGKGNFTRSKGLPAMYDNKSCVRPFDFDSDGDLDLFVGGRVLGYRYGHSPNSYLLRNDGKGNFTDRTAQLAPELRKAGMVTDGVWLDYNGDGDTDLVVVGDWMPVTIFENKDNKFSKVTDNGLLNQLAGFWQTVKAADFDKDGDLDLVLGNLGTNTKFRKKEDTALRMYVKDIDGNESMDHILSYRLHNNWYPVATKDELGKQLPLINKKFNNYEAYAGKTIEEVFDKDELKEALLLEVNTFESIYLENTGNGEFKKHLLPYQAQVSKIFALHVEDVNHDGHLDILAGGNLHGVSTYQGRYDGSYGLILAGNGKGGFRAVPPTESRFMLAGEVRDIKKLKTADGELMLVACNKQPLQLLKKLDSPLSAEQLASSITIRDDP
ncbi:VCBS repeat-containing protein [Pontibacter korlensis]